MRVHWVQGIPHEARTRAGALLVQEQMRCSRATPGAIDDCAHLLWDHRATAVLCWAVFRVSDGCNWGGGCPPPPPPVVTRRHNTRHKKTRSQIEPHRVPGGKQDNPSREACVCSRAQATTNSFFLFLGRCFPRRCHLCRWCRPLDRRLQSGPGGQSSCTRNDSSSTHQSNTHSAHSQSNCCGATGCTAPFLSTCRGRNTRRITLTFHFLSTHDRTVTKAVGRMQQTNRQSSEPTENTVSVDTASHLYAVHAMDG